MMLKTTARSTQLESDHGGIESRSEQICYCWHALLESDHGGIERILQVEESR